MGADGNQKEPTSELVQQVMKLLGYLPINFHLSLAGIKCPAPQKPSVENQRPPQGLSRAAGSFWNFPPWQQVGSEGPRDGTQAPMVDHPGSVGAWAEDRNRATVRVVPKSEHPVCPTVGAEGTPRHRGRRVVSTALSERQATFLVTAHTRSQFQIANALISHVT